MPTPLESRAALQLLTTTAVEDAMVLFGKIKGSADVRRAALLETVPSLVDYYSDGSAALAADFYEESRELAGIRTGYSTELVVADRTVKLRRGIAWSSEPLFTDLSAADLTALARLAEVIQLEVARPFRDTIITNRRNDPAAVGWRRITRGGCRFCRMLADRGAIYHQNTARFAAHGSCHCTAEPVFDGQHAGPEASVMQYVASRRSRTPAQQADLRAYLDAVYPE